MRRQCPCDRYDTYNDTGRTNGTPYYYVITAVDTSTNQSGASNEVFTTPVGDITPPAAPRPVDCCRRQWHGHAGLGG